MGLRATVRQILKVDPKELFRRYFINTLFDSTFVVLGILAAAAFVPEGNAEVALGTLFAACLAIGISTGVSVYEAEKTEGEIRIRRMERAMLRTLQETDLGRQMRASTYATAIVNFCAPLVVAALTGTPIFLHQEGVIPDFGTAALSSTIIAVGIIFLAGYHLGSLSGRRPWAKAFRMSTVALLTFTVLVVLERVL